MFFDSFSHTVDQNFQFCHTATLTNFLCYTQISPVQGKSAYWDFHLVRSLSHHSHQWIIPAPQAYCTLTTRILLLVSLWWYTAQRCWWFPSSHQDHPLMKESINPVSRIYLSRYCTSRQGWKTFLHRDNHVWTGIAGLEPATSWLTVMRSTYWTICHYYQPVRKTYKFNHSEFPNS